MSHENVGRGVTEVTTEGNLPRVLNVEDYSEKLRQALDKIDFTVLKSIFEELAAKSGMDAKNIKFRSRKDILGNVHAGSGKWYPKSEVIRLNPFFDDLSHAAIREYDPAVSYQNKVLSLIAHEETHAAGGNAIECINDDGQDKKYKVTMGLGESITKDPDVIEFESSTFNGFMEGLTQLISEAVCSEYIKRSGDRALYKNPYNKDIYMTSSYDAEKQVVELFIIMCSIASDIDVETIFRSLVGHHFRGDKPFFKLLEHNFVSDLLPKGDKKESRSDAYDYLEKYGDMPDFLRKYCKEMITTYSNQVVRNHIRQLFGADITVTGEPEILEPEELEKRIKQQINKFQQAIGVGNS